MRKDPITDEMLDELAKEIVQALVERLPELEPFAVKPEAVKYFDRGVPIEAWIVARSGVAAMFIGVEPEKFGVGFLGDDRELGNITFYPSPEIAVPAFIAASAPPSSW